jgi:phage RecT family recombinase
MADNAKLQELFSALEKLNIGSYITNAEEQKRFKRTVLDVVNYDTKLQEVSVESIIQCAVKGATLRLELNRHFNMVPRSDRKGEPAQAKFELTYQGYVTLLDRSNILGRANVVYENDLFDLDLAEETISHKPNLKGSRGEPLGVYAIINIENRKIIDYMSWTEIEEFKNKYLAYESPAWKKSATEMAKKTILKRTAKPYIHTDSADDSLREAQALDNATETRDGLTLSMAKATPTLDTTKIKVDVSALPKVDVQPVKEATKPTHPTEAQLKRFFAILNSKVSEEKREEFLENAKSKYSLESIKDMNIETYNELCEYLENYKPNTETADV